MATKKPRPGSIAARKAELRAAPKRKNRFNPLQRELDKPLAKSFKESAGVAAAIAGPGKIKQARKVAKKLVGKIKKTPAMKKVRREAADRAKPKRDANRVKNNNIERDLIKKGTLKAEKKIKDRARAKAIKQDESAGQKGIAAARKRRLKNESLLRVRNQQAREAKKAAGK